MAPTRCTQCGDAELLHAASCPRCGRRSDAIRTPAASGVLVERTDPLSVALRRILIVLLGAIVVGTWYAVAEYTRSQRDRESADEKAAECNEIEERGEDYFGELSDCRHRVAWLRLQERK
jgi:hypothetical protein